MIDPTLLRESVNEHLQNHLAYPADVMAWVIKCGDLLDENAALRERVKEADDATLEVIRERDELEDRLDQFAYRIAPVEVIGEHSSGNDPWLNALRMCVSAKDADDLLTRAERAESRLAALKEAAITQTQYDELMDVLDWAVREKRKQIDALHDADWVRPPEFDLDEQDEQWLADFTRKGIQDIAALQVALRNLSALLRSDP